MKQATILDEKLIADEVDGLLGAWRSKAVNLVCLIGIVAIIPSMAAVLSGRVFEVTWTLRVFCILLFLLSLCVVVMRRWAVSLRIGIILAIIGAVAVMQLAISGLAGSGRLSLVSLPLMTLVLIGPRAGWLVALVSLLLYAAVAALSMAGLGGWQVVDGSVASPSFWFLQGLRLAGVMLMLMVLLSQFLSLQRRTMIAERVALRKLQMETDERRRLEAQVADISEKERRSLGSELHDGVCQHLTAVLLNCAALENRQRATDARDAEDVTRIRQSIEESIDMAYDVARGLCPVDLDAAGLVPALETLCRAFKLRGIACELQADGNVSVGDPDRALQLYRIASEAMTNAIKHAGGTRIVVCLARGPDRLELSVSDDGRGIPEHPGDGLGLRIMAYRAGLMGGTLTVSGVPGQGTTVTCRVPDERGAS